MSTNTDDVREFETPEGEEYPPAKPLNPFADRDIAIPAWRIDAVQARVEKLRRKEAKLTGADTFGVEVVAEASFGHTRKRTKAEEAELQGELRGKGLAERRAIYLADQIKRTSAVPALVIELRGTTPEVPGGWSLVGVVSRLGEQCIVTRVPGDEREIDVAEYRSADRLRCDHCQTRRFRNEHFVVVNEAGETKLVGRNCLQDFLGGHSPEKLIRWAKLLAWLSSYARGGDSHEEEDWGYFRDHSGLKVGPYVALVCAHARENGFITGKAAREQDTIATSSTALDQYWARKHEKWHATVTQADEDEARAAIAWGQALEAKSDFDFNLRAIAETEEIPQRSIRRLAGIAAYLPQAVKRAQEREVAREREKAERPVSKHVGEIKKRTTLTLTKVAEHQIEGHYGTTWIERFETPDGSKVTWFASNPRIVKTELHRDEYDNWVQDRALAIGETAVVKATPKKHEEFRGEAVTVVARVVLVSLAAEQQEAC
jgi:hypothetical protein